MAFIAQTQKTHDVSLLSSADEDEMLKNISRRKMRERILVTDRNTGETYYTTVGDALLSRLIDIGLYSDNEKNAIVAAKFAIEQGLGKAGIRQEEEKEEMPEIQFKLTPTQNKELLRKSALPVPAADEEEDDSGKIIVEIEGEPGVMKYD